MYLFRIHLSLGIVILVLTFSPTKAQQQPFDYPEYSYSSLKQTNSSTTYTPSPARLSLQFGSGVLLGVGGGAVTGLTAGLIAPEKEGFDLTGLEYAVTGFYLGYSTISALGIYLAANTKTFKASFGSILLGHGFGAGIGVGSLFLVNSIDGQTGIALGIALASPIVGGLIANNLSIDKRNSTSALLNISDDKASFSTPSIEIEKMRSHNVTNRKIQNSYSPMVKLLNISL